MDRRIAEIPASEWDDLNIDLTPRDAILSYLIHAFPVQLQEPFTDDGGNLMSRPATDEDGKPILCKEAEARRDALIEQLAALPPVPTALDQIVQHFGHEAVAEVTGRSRRVLRITDAKGERLALRSRPASANLAETAAFMDGNKRILVFSMAGGTGRSYHADLSCGNTERRIHYLLEPGWRADQAIQGLGRTHRTHQASAPLFRPVTTDVKGERRFIATIARRLDSLGAITRGQRDSQTAMGGSDAALFRESDNLESAYAKAALRQFYSALWRGSIEGWTVERFQESTGLKIVHEGGLKDELPPMPRFLNRLLALPIAEQNQLFADLEERIAANIEQAIEAGSYEAGVETVIADSLAIAGRETLHEHSGAGAATELVEIVRRDRLEPLGAGAALEIGARDPGPDGRPRLVVNTRSRRAAVLMPAPSRMRDDGGVQERVQLIRPAARERMAEAEFTASNWGRADERHWRMLWDREIGELPSPPRVPLLARHRPAAAGLGPPAGREHARAPAHGRLRRVAYRARARRRAGAHRPRGLRPRRRSRHDRCRGIRSRHEARQRACARQRMAARAPPAHGRRPHRDRGAGRYRPPRAPADRLHGRDRFVPRPDIRAERGHGRAHPRPLAARRLSPEKINPSMPGRDTYCLPGGGRCRRTARSAP